MRCLLILIPCFLFATFQDGQGKKPSLPPLPEAEVPAPPGLEPEKSRSRPQASADSAKTPSTQAAPVEGAPKGPSPRPGIGKVQRSLMGVWRVLPTASLGGNSRKSVKGYLIITKAHLSFQLMVESRGDQGSFQTGVRRLLDPLGLRETRKFALTAPNVLRLIQPKGQILEFQRVEQL